MDEVDVLKNLFKFSGSKNDFLLDLSFESYETMGKSNSDRYEFIYPYYTLNKLIDFNQPLIESIEANDLKEIKRILIDNSIESFNNEGKDEIKQL